MTSQGLAAAGLLFALVTMSLMLILDINRPAGGAIRESQVPMVALSKRCELSRRARSTAGGNRLVNQSAAAPAHAA